MTETNMKEYPKLPAFEIVIQAFQTVWERRSRFGLALLVPFLVLVMFSVFPLFFIDVELEPGDIPGPSMILPGILISLISMMLYILFAITCHRLVILPDEAVPKFGMLGWGKREFRFTGLAIALPLVYILSFFIIMFLMGLLSELKISLSDFSGGEGSLSGIFLTMILCHIPSTYFFSRFSLLFPATAVDEDRNIEWAWTVSKKNGWRLFIVVGILPFLPSLIMGILPFLQPEPGDIIFNPNFSIIKLTLVTAFNFVFLAVTIVALSLSYKFLTENRVEEKQEAV